MGGAATVGPVHDLGARWELAAIILLPPAVAFLDLARLGFGPTVWCWARSPPGRPFASRPGDLVPTTLVGLSPDYCGAYQ